MTRPSLQPTASKVPMELNCMINAFPKSSGSPSLNSGNAPTANGS